MKPVKNIIAIHPGKKCRPLDEYIAGNHEGCNVEKRGDFRFKPGFLFRYRKYLSKKHDLTLIYVKPPFNYFKKLFIYFLFLFIPSCQKLVITDDGDRIVEIRLHDGFSLALMFLPAVFLSVFIQVNALFYLFCSGIYLKLFKRTGKTKSKNKKIAYLVPSLQLLDKFKGSTSHVRGVINGFKKLGWEVSIFCPGKMTGIDGDYQVIPPVFRELLTGGVIDMLYDVIFTYRALPVINREKPDFLYQRHGRYCIGGVMLSCLTGIPLVLEMNALLGWESGRWSNTGGWMRKYIAGYEKLCVKYSNKISAISKILREDIIKAGADENKVFVNPNGADAEVFKPGCGGEEVRKELSIENKVIIGFSGSFYPWHGIDVLTEVIERTIPEFSNVVFLLIGDGPERDSMESRLEKNFRIIFTGRIPPDEVPKYLDACDILLSPIGKGKEYSSPIKIFEYMAMGKVILCFDTGQMSNILENGKDSVMTPPGDIELFISELFKLIKDEKYRLSLGNEARKKAEKNYTWKANVERVIENILENGMNIC